MTPNNLLIYLSVAKKLHQQYQSNTYFAEPQPGVMQWKAFRAAYEEGLKKSWESLS